MRPDTKAIRARAEAAAQHDKHRRAVIAWMDAEGRAGRLRQNANAPSWSDYERTRVVFETFVSLAPADVGALCDRVEELEAALRSMADDGCIRQWVSEPDCATYASRPDNELPLDDWCAPCQAAHALADASVVADPAPGATNGTEVEHG
jgi:hypothetical protein